MKMFGRKHGTQTRGFLALARAKWTKVHSERGGGVTNTHKTYITANATLRIPTWGSDCNREVYLDF